MYGSSRSNIITFACSRMKHLSTQLVFFLSYNYVGVAWLIKCYAIPGNMDFLALTSLLAQKYTPFCSGSLSAVIKFSLEQQFSSGGRTGGYTKVIMQC